MKRKDERYKGRKLEKCYATRFYIIILRESAQLIVDKLYLFWKVGKERFFLMTRGYISLSQILTKEEDNVSKIIKAEK